MEIKRKEEWNRALYIDGTKEIKRIKFYNEKGVIFTVNQGWLEDVSQSFTLDTKSIEVGDLKKKIKKDFSKKENFYISLGKDWDNVVKYEVYIYLDSYKKEIEKDEMNSGYFYVYEKYLLPLKNKRGTGFWAEEEWHDEILIKFYSHSERTEENQKMCDLQERIEKKINKYLTMDEIEYIVEEYKKTKEK